MLSDFDRNEEGHGSVLNRDMSLKIADVDECTLDEARAHLEERVESGAREIVSISCSGFSIAEVGEGGVYMDSVADSWGEVAQPVNSDSKPIVSYAHFERAKAFFARDWARTKQDISLVIGSIENVIYGIGNYFGPIASEVVSD